MERFAGNVRAFCATLQQARCRFVYDRLTWSESNTLDIHTFSEIFNINLDIA